MKIQAAVIEEKGASFQIVDMELDPPQAGEVLVKITACGVCHTDDVARQQIIPVPLPAVFGHEGCGVIEAVGPGVTGYSAGDRVSFSFGYCGVCEACRTGQPYGCKENRRLNFMGGHFDGTKRLHYKGGEVSAFFGQGAFATHAVVHQHNLVPVDKDVPLELMGPMGCGIQTGAGAIFNCLQGGADYSVIITGCGGVGLSAVMAAKIAGYGMIIACDTVQSRLDLALELGATHIINAGKVDSVVEETKKLTGGEGAYHAVDCTGSGACVRQSLNCLRPLGKCAILGATQELTIHVEDELMGPAKTLIGIVEGYSIPQVFIPKLVEYYKRGEFPFDRLIRYYDFSEINTAFEDMKNGSVIKAVLKMV